MTRQEFKDVLQNEAIYQTEKFQDQYGRKPTKDEQYDCLIAAMKALTATLMKSDIDFSPKDIREITKEIWHEWCEKEDHND